MMKETKVVLVFAKTISLLIRLAHVGAGLTWPGELALRLKPNLLRDFSVSGVTIILISGTNGKTTTAKMAESVLALAGRKVRRNASGANLDNGIASAIVEDVDWLGNLRSDTFLFEADEAALSTVVLLLKPKIVVLLNLFRDQLDRYGEVDTIAERWLNMLSELTDRTQIIINGDDPHLSFLGQHMNTHVLYFGLDDPGYFLPKIQHATDSLYCPKCGARLTFGGVYFSHLGKWTCGKCGFTHPELYVTSKDFKSPLPGIYNIYNSLAAATVAKALSVSPEIIRTGLREFTPAFGRLENIEYRNKSVTVVLSKNPTGFNESLRTVLASGNKGPLLLILNDRIPDGRDVSWIWDVDFEELAESDREILVSGDRCYDLAIRIKYAGVSSQRMRIYENLTESVESGTEAVSVNERLWILPTYSAMLETRKILTGKHIL